MYQYSAAVKTVNITMKKIIKTIQGRQKRYNTRGELASCSAMDHLSATSASREKERHKLLLSKRSLYSSKRMADKPQKEASSILADGLNHHHVKCGIHTL